MNKLVVSVVILLAALGIFVASSSFQRLQKPEPEEPTPRRAPVANIRRDIEPAVVTPEPESKPESKPEQPHQPKPKPEPPKTFEARMTLFVVADSAAQLHLEGKTTLPAGTLFQVTTKPDIRLGTATVRDDGTFATNTGAIRRGGTYAVTVRTDASDQSTTVNRIIGRKGENLKGPFATVTGFLAQGEFKITGKPFRRLPIAFKHDTERELVDSAE